MNDQFEQMINLTEKKCQHGIIVSAPSTISIFNDILYFLALLYCFLGTAIIADVFMCSIEKITSSTRKVKLKCSTRNAIPETANPEEGIEEVRIWNPTVANLSLMALGSSAPEILLSVIEIIANRFRIGDLGPGTIIGSAAFNLLCITAVCIMAVPSPTVKRVQEKFVFLTTSLFSCLAYIWLLVILVVISPNVVELWEALVTFALFFLLIIVAYLVDIKIWQQKKIDQNEEYQIDGVNDVKYKDDDIDMHLKKFANEMGFGKKMVKSTNKLDDQKTLRFILQWILRVHPNLSPVEQSKLLISKLRNIQNRDFLCYRLQMVQKLTAATQKMDSKWESKKMKETDEAEDASIVGGAVEFSARTYFIPKEANKVNLRIIRHRPTDKSVSVRYSTKSGVVKKDIHFLSKLETVKFQPGEKVKEIYVNLVERTHWRPGDLFYVSLRLLENDQENIIGETNIARVEFVDISSTLTNKPIVQFVKTNYIVKENQKYVRVFVTYHGQPNLNTFNVYYKTEDVTAKCGKDYKGINNGVLTFVGDEYEKYIDVRIYDDMNEEKDETFNIHLTSSTGGVTIGPNKFAVITIICDDNVLQNIITVRKLTSFYFKQMMHESDIWLERLIQATSVNAGDIENATLEDCVLHLLSMPWKVMAVLVPSTTIMGGWLAFFCALVLIGFITAIIGDLASILGCMIGLKDAVTAITLVALGTSLPDTFASKIAAQNDVTADNAIGNITGSNAVNVFLGLGLPWSIAAIYWFIRNEVFVVNAGSLHFSVAIFMTTSVVCMVLLIARRVLVFFGKGELGGPIGPKLFSVLILVTLWLGYVLLSVLQTYNYISV